MHNSNNSANCSPALSPIAKCPSRDRNSSSMTNLLTPSKTNQSLLSSTRLTPIRTSASCRYALSKQVDDVGSRSKPHKLYLPSKFNTNSSFFSPNKLGSKIKLPNNVRDHLVTHQAKYARAGSFPVVHFFKKNLPVITPRQNACVMRLSANGSTLFDDSPENVFEEMQNVANSSCASDSSAHSVLDALKEISRKRIQSDGKDKVDKRLQEVATTSDNLYTKRAREEDVSSSPSLQDENASKRVCVVDAIYASGTSSVCLKTNKRKLYESWETNEAKPAKKKLATVETQTNTVESTTLKPISKTVDIAVSTDPLPTDLLSDQATANLKAKPITNPTESEQETEQCGAESEQRMWDEKVYAIHKKNKLAKVLSRFTGEEPKLIPVPNIWDANNTTQIINNSSDANLTTNHEIVASTTSEPLPTFSSGEMSTIASSIVCTILNTVTTTTSSLSTPILSIASTQSSTENASFVLSKGSETVSSSLLGLPPLPTQLFETSKITSSASPQILKTPPASPPKMSFFGSAADVQLSSAAISTTSPVLNTSATGGFKFTLPNSSTAPLLPASLDKMLPISAATSAMSLNFCAKPVDSIAPPANTTFLSPTSTGSVSSVTGIGSKRETPSFGAFGSISKPATANGLMPLSSSSTFAMPSTEKQPTSGGFLFKPPTLANTSTATTLFDGASVVSNGNVTINAPFEKNAEKAQTSTGFSFGGFTPTTTTKENVFGNITSASKSAITTASSYFGTTNAFAAVAAPTTITTPTTTSSQVLGTTGLSAFGRLGTATTSTPPSFNSSFKSTFSMTNTTQSNLFGSSVASPIQSSGSSGMFSNATSIVGNTMFNFGSSAVAGGGFGAAAATTTTSTPTIPSFGVTTTSASSGFTSGRLFGTGNGFENASSANNSGFNSNATSFGSTTRANGFSSPTSGGFTYSFNPPVTTTSLSSFGGSNINAPPVFGFGGNNTTPTSPTTTANSTFSFGNATFGSASSNFANQTNVANTFGAFAKPTAPFNATNAFNSSFNQSASNQTFGFGANNGQAASATGFGANSTAPVGFGSSGSNAFGMKSPSTQDGSQQQSVFAFGTVDLSKNAAPAAAQGAYNFSAPTNAQANFGIGGFGAPQSGGMFSIGSGPTTTNKRVLRAKRRT